MFLSQITGIVAKIFAKNCLRRSEPLFNCYKSRQPIEHKQKQISLGDVSFELIQFYFIFIQNSCDPSSDTN